MKSQYGTIERNGFALRYCIEGTGEPIFIIGSIPYYQRLFSASLRETNTLIFLDHRGFLQAPPTANPATDYTLEELIEDTEAVRQHLGLNKIWVAGHSGNGFIALEYAKKFSNYVYGVILVAVSPSFSNENHAITDLHFETLAKPARIERFKENMVNLAAKIDASPQQAFKLRLQAYHPRSWLDLNFDTSFLWDGVYTNMPALDHLWGEVFRDICITADLEEFYSPVWLALGKFDFVTGPKEQWDLIAKNFHDLTIELFEESAHNPSYEEANSFNQKLADWMALYY